MVNHHLSQKNCQRQLHHDMCHIWGIHVVPSLVTRATLSTCTHYLKHWILCAKLRGVSTKSGYIRATYSLFIVESTLPHPQLHISHIHIHILASQGSKLPLADCLCKAGKCADSYYTITAIDFATHYCISSRNNENTRSNLKTDTRLVRIAI